MSALNYFLSLMSSVIDTPSCLFPPTSTLNVMIYFADAMSAKYRLISQGDAILTHWGRVTHICVSKLNINGSDNGLALGRRQAIVWTNAKTLLIWPFDTNFNETITEIYIFSVKKMHSKIWPGKLQPFCPGLDVLIYQRRGVVFGLYYCIINNSDISTGDLLTKGRHTPVSVY